MSQNSGKIVVVMGPMFSQKSSRLVNFLNKEKQRDQNILYYKVSLTTKQIQEYPITTHDGIAFNGACFLIPPDFDFYAHIKSLNATAVAIDEFQFFSAEWDVLLARMVELVSEGRKLFLAGLDKDYKGKPFTKLAFAACEADIVEKTTAICFRCNADATHTFKYAGSEKRLEEGGEDKYKPVCRFCFNFLQKGT